MTRIASKKIARTTVAAGGVLTGCVLFTGTPAFGAVAPETEPSGVGQPSQSVIDHYSVDTTGSVSSSGQLTKAQIEADERAASTNVSSVGSTQTKAQIEADERAAAGSQVPGVLSAQTKAQIEMLERAAAEKEAANTVPATSSSDDGDVSVPLTVLALLGGGLITGAAGSYTVYRMRHHGPVSTATA